VAAELEPFPKDHAPSSTTAQSGILAAAFGIYRIGANKTMIEQLESAGSWLVYGEYETEDQTREVFDDLLLEPTNLQA
jgi:hypothetical protein